MSIAGIASSLFSQISGVQTGQRSKIQSEFQQLAQDLKTGNLTQAQSDFALLTQSAPATPANGHTSLSQSFSALSKDLQSGNLTAAQQDFATIQQDISTAQQNAQANGQFHFRHHHADASPGAPSVPSPQSTIAQILRTLGQDLQTGNLSNAQQAYATLQQDLQQLGINISPAASPAVSGVSLNA